MAHFYAVTTQKPTAVSGAVVCNLNSDKDTNLVLSKGNVLEIYHLVQKHTEGEEDTSSSTTHLQLQCELSLFGRIHFIHKYNLPNSKLHVLFILTEHKYFCVIEYDSITKKTTKKACGDLKGAIGRSVDTTKCIIDPLQRMIGMHLYEGHLKILPMPSNGGFLDSFDVRLLEIKRLVDVVCLYGCSRPMLAVLHEDDSGARHVRTYSVDFRERELGPGSWSCTCVEGEAHTLIPVKSGGIILIGNNSIMFYSGIDRISQIVTMEPCIIQSWERLDGGKEEEGNRFLLGDVKGLLYVLTLCRDTNQTIFSGTNIKLNSSSSGTISTTSVTGISLDIVGKTTLSSTISYLGDGLVYIGSCYGDSQLIQLQPNPYISEKENQDATSLERNDISISLIPNYIKFIETHSNLGPILDMEVLPSEKEGQNAVVTCSGAWGQGTIRVIRSGIGMQRHAELELPGIKGMWSLTGIADDSGKVFDKYLIQSFLGETRILAIDGQEMEEFDIPGMNLETETIYCTNAGINNSLIIQATRDFIHLIDVNSLELVHTYAAPNGATFLLASGYSSTSQNALNSLLIEGVSIAMSGGGLFCLEVDVNQKQLVVAGDIKFDQDIASTCAGPELASMVPIRMNACKTDSGTHPSGRLIANALWTDNTIRVIYSQSDIKKMTEVLSLSLGLDTQARDVLLVSMGGDKENNPMETRKNESINYLMVGLGDGALLVYTLDICFTTETSTTCGVSINVSNRRIVRLGSKPIGLTSLTTSNGDFCVFASGDRPTIVHSRNNKLVFTVVNVEEVTGLARFNCELFPNSLAMSTTEGIVVGAIDDIQRLHVQTHKVDGDPRRIVHDNDSGSFAVCTEKKVYGEKNSDEYVLGQVIFLQDDSLEQFHSFELDRLEQAISCVVCHLIEEFQPENKDSKKAAVDGDKKITTYSDQKVSSSPKTSKTPLKAQKNNISYVVVGTAYVTPPPNECEKGRILVFRILNDLGEKKVQLVSQKDVDGPVFTMCNLKGSLACGIQDKVQVFSWKRQVDTDVENMNNNRFELVLECGYCSNILVLYLKSQGEFLLNGDMMRSLSLLQYENFEPTTNSSEKVSSGKSKKQIREVARDFNTNYMRAIEILGDSSGSNNFGDYFLGADDSGNIFATSRRASVTATDSRGRMEPQGEFHLGDYINVFSKGTLSSEPIHNAAEQSINANTDEQSSSREWGRDNDHYQSSTLHGSVSGAIGSVFLIDNEKYSFFSSLEKAILSNVPSIGGLPHNKWRSFKNERRTCSQRNIIDGDLIESILSPYFDSSLLDSILQSLDNELLQERTGAGLASNGSQSMSNVLERQKAKGEKWKMEDVITRVEEISRAH